MLVQQRWAIPEPLKVGRATSTALTLFSLLTNRLRGESGGNKFFMPKIEVPTSAKIYVQWILHPFPTPHVAEHKSSNSKWALAQTKDLLKTNCIDSDKLTLAMQCNGKILLEIMTPGSKLENGEEFWAVVFNILKKSNNVESISIFVNNEISDKIASNLADRVPLPWRQGYQGYNTTTLIYHK